MKTQKIYYFLSIIALLFTMFSCKEEEDNDELLSESVRITSFSLDANDSVLAHLDTVFFTIDLTRGQIYNADSLPKGTDVSALVANIKFDNVGKAEVIVEKENPEDSYTINYVTHPGDSIDFTGKVTLKVTSSSGLTVKNYSLKVNVHQIIPDSMYWTAPFSVRPLPCGKEVTVDAQKAIYFHGSVYSWVSVGSTTMLYTAQNPYDTDWVEQPLSLSFTPNLNSIQVAGNLLYMLSTDGELFKSEDGIAWSECGSSFYSLQGTWKSQLLGIIVEDGVYKHDYYPRPEGYTPVAVADNFPISGSSPMVTFVSSYDLENPQSIMVGGKTQHGKLTGATWGYDGYVWAQLPGSIQPCEGALLFPYFSFSTNEYWETTEYSAWMAIGGRTEQGASNSVYVSINNANTWTLAKILEVPSYIKPRAFASVMVVESDYVAKPKGWRMMPATSPMQSVTRTADYKIPYIYIFGGENNSGKVYNEIWRGAIGRLTYPPIP